MASGRMSPRSAVVRLHGTRQEREEGPLMTIHSSTAKRVGTVLATSGVLFAAMATLSRGDDPPANPSRLGRLFRLGGNRSTDSPVVGKSGSDGAASPATRRSVTDAPPPYPSPVTSPIGSSLPAYGPLRTANATPTTANARLVPQPRTSRAATESDPLVTRVSIGRSDDGKPFCMFIEVFADGTILDSEGVHHVGTDHLKPIAQLLQAGDLAKLKGHCGGPAADFIEQVHVIAYDRYHGRLRATPFSYSGNPQGCDPSVKKLNDAIDALQTKLVGQPVTRSAGTIPVGAHSPDGSVPPPFSAPIGLTPDGKP